MDDSDESDNIIVPVMRILVNGNWAGVPMMRGEPGEPGVFVGESEPTDPNAKLWITPIGTPDPVTGNPVILKLKHNGLWYQVQSIVGPKGDAGDPGWLKYAESSGGGSIPLQDQTVNYRTAASQIETYTIPVVPSGRSRDLIISVEIPSNWTSSMSYTVNVSGITVKSYVADPLHVGSVVPGATYVFALTEIKPSVFMVTRKLLENVA